MARYILYAPNVHTGGGLVLLRALLEAWPRGFQLLAFFDIRARDILRVPDDVEVQWCRPTFRSRYGAELALQRAAKSEDIVICFHGLPPIKRVRGQVIVFLQNRNTLGLNSLFLFNARTAARIGLERLLSRAFRHRVDRYIVQSDTMRFALESWYTRTLFMKVGSPRVSVLPFAEKLILPQRRKKAEYDFVYVADGVAHKNHVKLLAAWKLLASEGIRPSLVLTLSDRDTALAELVAKAIEDHNINVVNLGQMSHGDVNELYAKSSALIFPSTSESFGLPLIEASALDLPIIAGELDYVRDVCDPVETFDPESSRSIARAVRRFLGRREPLRELLSPLEFIENIASAGDKK